MEFGNREVKAVHEVAGGHRSFKEAFVVFAINKGGTMKSLFHPYVRGFLLRADIRGFFFLYKNRP